MTYSGLCCCFFNSRLFFSHFCSSLVEMSFHNNPSKRLCIHCGLPYSTFPFLYFCSMIVPLRFNTYNSCIKTILFFCRSVLPWDVLPVRGTLCSPALLLPSSPVPTTSCASLPSQKATSTSVAPTVGCLPVSEPLPSYWELTTRPPTDPTNPLLHKFHLNSSLNTFLS